MLYRGLYFKELFRIISGMKRHKWKYLTVLLISCLDYGAAKILIGFLNKDLINSVVQNDRQLLVRAFVTAAVCVVLSCGFYPLVMYEIGKSVKDYMLALRTGAVKHLLNMPVSGVYGSSKGEMMSRLTVDLNLIDTSLTEQLWSVLRDIIYGIGSCVIMLLLDPRLSAVVLLLGIASALVNSVYLKKSKLLSDMIQKKLGTLSQQLIDVVEGSRIQKMYGLDGIIKNKYSSENGQIARFQMKRTVVSAKIDGINFMLSTFNVIGVLGIGIYMFLSGLIDIGSIIAVITLQAGVTNMFLQVGVFLSQLQGSMAGAKRFFEFMDEAEEVSVQALKEGSGLGAAEEDMLVLKNVDFCYDRSSKLLDGVSLSVPKGKMAALVGASGSGKTTVIRLILRFLEHGSGSIFLEGRSIDAYSLEELRSKISYVQQDSFLFDCSIEENIRLGRPDSSKEDIVEAARTACADEFINRMQQGYDTRVGENGVLISGGQKQRIAIARAVLKDSPVLLLDEATSSLDSENEFLVQKAIDNMVRDKTVLVIAHRLSTIRNADIIYVLDSGRIAEIGSHRELLGRKGLYYKMYVSGLKTVI
ncbi:ABC-type multidrug transport system fused ATPase/permease subunit [Ruminiclostridium sufflavum DSM 19573]|uniref:ABC-type multidrug transport system fused ATPase/permease subunit n=1 Tax=Ruminiclostridium sufflavum DSM 19573 TaxID=1121337 RepID=A0A318XRL4_9FIRM|nr:ABC transporter ATP-binding protein [Ruminiclostridium sufflavum]PYG90227.1 ABC-type multidrug transport system fused ATPase/permease subunit [Ruminiclostridium sufflavum DSM 19573]